MIGEIYKNSKPYDQSIALDVNGSITMAPGTYVQGSFFARAASLGILTDTGQVTMGAIPADSTLLLYTQVEGSAVLGANTVYGTNIVDGTVANVDLAANSVESAAIKAGAVTNVKLAANAVETAAINANAVTNVKIAANAVESTAIAANAVTNVQIAANAVDVGLKIDTGNCSGCTVTTSAFGLKITVP